MSKRLTEDKFYAIKRLQKYGMFWSTSRIAKRLKISEKTVLQAKGSQTMDDYQENVKAQHPPTEHSLRDDLMIIHWLMFGHNKGYVHPKTGAKAAEQIMIDLIMNKNEEIK